MGGGLMQLVAYGAQDIYLTGNPQITFFKVVYRRHTNFSVESIEQTFNGTPNFSKKASATISRNGDLIHKVMLQVTLEQVTAATANDHVKWCNWVGEKIIKYVEVEIGGQRIDRHYGEWLHIWSQLTLPSGHDTGYARMTGNIPDLIKVTSGAAGGAGNISSNTLFIPLQFWFCRNPGLALPLIALQYHEVKINIEFNDLYDCLLYHKTGTGTNNEYSTNLSPSPNIQSASLWVDYIYLDSDERRRFAQLAHEYLIEQLQYPGEETISVTSNKIKLAFNHPVKEIVWVVQKQDAIDFKQHFNYTSVLDKTPFSQDNNLGNNLAYGIAEMLQVTTSSSAIHVVNEDKGVNNCQLARLQLNGQDRFAERTGDYFNYVQPFYHHSRTPAPGINVYSFGLKPEEHQPSGTCNFSRIDNANLFLTVTSDTLKKNTVTLEAGKITSTAATGSSGNAKVRVYAVNYNVLRIMSGMGGLAYSN
jgi:hypothetical protein